MVVTASCQLLPTFVERPTVNNIDWSPDGARLAVATTRGVEIRDAATDTVLVDMPVSADDGVIYVEWSPDGSRVAGAEWNMRNIRVWDADSGELLGSMETSIEDAFLIEWSPDGERLISVGFDAEFIIWDTITYQSISSEYYAGVGRDVELSPDGTRLAIATFGGVLIRDMGTGAYEAILTGYDQDVMSVSWGPDGTKLASGGLDGTVRVWDFARDQQVRVFDGTDDMRIGGKVTWLSEMLLADRVDRLRIWNTDAGQLIYTSDVLPGNIYAWAWNPARTQVANSNPDGTISIICIDLQSTP
jgi:WD40 repeat protein